MANYITTDTELTSVANAIRTKGGTSSSLTYPNGFVSAIENIPSGGGGPTVEDCTFTGDISYLNYNNHWAWVFNKYPDKVRLNNITDASYAFYNSKPATGNTLTTLSSITMNIDNNGCPVIHLFENNEYLQTPLLINGPIYNLERMFYDNRRLTSQGLANCLQGADFSKLAVQQGTQFNSMFYTCYSLTEIPSRIFPLLVPNADSGCYNYMFYSCNTLGEINNLGVATSTLQYINNFASAFSRCMRLKSLTFNTNSGVPYEAQWNNQTIDLSSYVGYAQNSASIMNYKSGITGDTLVWDDATYQALKDNPDYWTVSVDYSRYNHQSAVETINSLPDCHLYGTNNVIKFKGSSGRLTDEGAVNTLTASEIQVATDKGWTVTLV